MVRDEDQPPRKEPPIVNEERVFDEPDLTVDNYRQFSGLALLTFLACLLGAGLAILNKNLVWTAFLAAFFALVAIGILYRNRKELIGFRLCSIGLFIALFAGSATLSYWQYRYDHLAQTAVEFGEEWLDLVKQGRMHEAYQLTLRPDWQRSPGTDLARVYGSLENPGRVMHTYLRQEPEKSIREDGEAAKITLREIRYSRPRLASEQFELEYEYERPDGENRIFRVQFVRSQSLPPLNPLWHIETVINVDPFIRRVMTDEQVRLDFDEGD